MSSSSPSGRNVTISDEDDSEWGSGGAVACVILGVCFVVGVPGNLVVVWTIMRHVKQRCHTLLLILHLAAADLLVLVTLPVWIYSLVHSWVFGQMTCKAMVYTIQSCMYASIFLITVMSVERFLAVKFPFKMLQWKTSKIMYWILVVAWALAFLLGIPAFLVQVSVENPDGTQDCTYAEFSSEALEVLRLYLETLMGFVIPFFILAVCYCQVASQLRQIQSRTKQKTAFLISSVVVAFALCWLPHHILNVINIVQLQVGQTEWLPETAVYISGAVPFISSTVNPILYAFAARNFQGGLRKSAMAKLFQEVASYSFQGREKEPPTLNCSDNDTNKEDTAQEMLEIC